MTNLLPSRLGALAQALESCFDERLNLIENPISSLWDVSKCPAALLPYLAEALSCEIWDSDWPEERQRATLKKWLIIRAKRGTPFAVLEAFRQLGIQADIEEEDKPKEFKVTFWFDENTPQKLEQTPYLASILDSLKPVAAHRTFLGVGTRVNAQEGLVGTFSMVEILRFDGEMVR
jgi:phage tail P2-like protein